MGQVLPGQAAKSGASVLRQLRSGAANLEAVLVSIKVLSPSNRPLLVQSLARQHTIFCCPSMSALFAYATLCIDGQQKDGMLTRKESRGVLLRLYLQRQSTGVQERSPAAAVHAYKTTVPPLLKDCQSADGTFEAAAMGKRAHVLALMMLSPDTWLLYR